MNTFIGIDFSGALFAGRKIWIAEACPDKRGLHVTSLERADRLLDVNPHRDSVLPALVEHISAQSGAVAGMDFPFSLPECALFVRPWHKLALQAAAKFADADAMRDWCWLSAGSREVLRETERAAVTPFAAYNRWIKFQTYFGITQVIAPLLRAGAASFPPMTPAHGPKPAVVEVCPSSTLRSFGIDPRRYKGRAPERRDRRSEIIATLRRGAHGLDLPPELERKAIENSDGDALDALIAAVAASRAAQTIASGALKLAGHPDEGHVFV